MVDRLLSRRDVLLGLTAAGSTVLLAACGPSAGSASPAVPTASATRTPTPTIVPTQSPTPTAAPSPTPDEAQIRRWAARMVLIGFRGTTVDDEAPVAAAVRAGLGGVILFGRDQTTGGPRNIESPAQLARLTTALRSMAPGPLRIAIDQEGGRVNRLDPAHGFPPTPSQSSVGAGGDPAEAERVGRRIGTTMAEAGLDLDLAPVVDVDVDPTNPAIGALDRSFSADPAVVATMAAAEIRGLHSAGVRATLKHFPGIGSASANTDFDQADVSATWTDMELDPYRSLFASNLPDAVMSAHVTNGQLDPDLPASLSPATIDGLLRTGLGWTGPVVTDDMGAVAITSRYPRDEAIALAIEAGNDLLTFANQAVYEDDLAQQVIDTIVGHVRSGRISPGRLRQSVERLEALAGPPS